MNKNIIKKLGLTPTDKSFGSTLLFGITVYYFEDGIYCASANENGFPNKEDCCIFFGNGYIMISNEFLHDGRLSDIREMLIPIKPNP